MKKITPLILVFVLLTAILFAGCDEVTPAPVDTQKVEQQKTEENQKRLIANDTMPIVDQSLERLNLIRRLNFMNQGDRISYMYTFSDQGQLIEEQQVLGKISSVNSLLTTPNQIVKKRGDFDEGSNCYQSHVVASPDFDGSYGENGDAIFWFSPIGEYNEWNGIYYFSSTRQSFTVNPILMEVQ